jgi:hypothetical protein
MEEMLKRIFLKLEHIEREQMFFREELKEVKKAQQGLQTSMRINHEETMNELAKINEYLKNIK